ncbi:MULTISPECIES: hypothetical protein [Rhodococcus]|uniref:Uncharacterized protein n=1 Tax=Rhodococcus maanshanensis TaxID=183556 RepID=A0A1H7MRT4_9NOCA|nr:MULTISPECIES: hypothetical protein [Rhodococcus]SEL13317.1 hypothetical protein SAMN05444583_106103 [Rhodococcus maanshanensis]
MASHVAPRIKSAAIRVVAAAALATGLAVAAVKRYGLPAMR